MSDARFLSPRSLPPDPTRDDYRRDASPADPVTRPARDAWPELRQSILTLCVAPRFRCVLTARGGSGGLTTSDPELAAGWIARALGAMGPGDVLDVYRDGRNIGARIAARLMKAADAVEIEQAIRAA